MTILYIHQYFNTPHENGGTRSYDLASRFVKNGHKVILITSTRGKFSFPNNKRWNTLNVNGIEVHFLRNDYNKKMPFHKRIISFLTFAIFSSIHLLKLKGDLVLATSTPLSIAIPAIVKKIFQNTPFIFEVRDVWPEAAIALKIVRGKLLIKFLLWFELYIYRKSSFIVALSEDMKSSITKRCTSLPPITVIPNISELDRFKKTQRSKVVNSDNTQKIVLYAGSVAIVNNIEYAVKLAALLLKIDDSIIFHVYSNGQGNRFQAVKQLASDKGILNVNFFLKESVPKNELPDIYNNVTVASSFVADVPELWANSANKFFDTLAAGKPIVINHEGWQAQEIRKSNIGFVLDHNEEHLQQTAKDFSEYLNNYPLLKIQEENAYKIAIEKYSLSIAVENYEKVFKEIASDTKN